MPWTIPNLLLHDKSVTLSNMRSLGRTRVFVYCSNPDCHHNAEVDVSGFPDDVTFNDLQPRMLCTVCDHRRPELSPVMAASWLIGRALSPIRFH
ncbi:MAG TPA: hypothetical protein VN831_11780, partial [Bradyrhizobium sp.]|nr:hypothetical protein [Bradyrhizobium sp.]